MKTLLLLLALLSANIFAQISITRDDAFNFYKAGNTWKDYSSDTLSGVTVDVGTALNSSQEWTFPSNIQFADTAVYNNIDPKSSPFASDFPNATHCFTLAMEMQGMQVMVYTYIQISETRLITLGTGFSLAGNPFKTEMLNDTSTYFPITYGGKHTSTKKIGDEQTYSEITTTEECDGFGKISTPFGTFDSLRIVASSEIKVYAAGNLISSTSAKRISFTSKAINVTFDLEENSSVSGVVNAKVASIEVYDLTATGVAKGNAVADNFKLNQNYPNPFNPETVISYQLPVSGHVELKIFDMLGREVETLVNTPQCKGSYNIKFDGSRLSSGVYLYQLKSGEFVQTQKMILSK